MSGFHTVQNKLKSLLEIFLKTDLTIIPPSNESLFSFNLSYSTFPLFSSSCPSLKTSGQLVKEIDVDDLEV